MRIEYHRTLIADQVRNEALFKALERVIRKGETTVADIGAGTGLLGLMASRLGAREVHLYEANEGMAQVAADVLRINRARNCHLYPCRSTDMIDPPKVDVVISETLGNYALEENIIETLNDARRRMLNPGGIVVPCAIQQYAAPVVSSRIADELEAWSKVGHGLDLAPARRKSINNAYVRRLGVDDLMGGRRCVKLWDEIDLSRPQKSARKAEVSWVIERAATIRGFACWWEACLISGVSLSTAPDAPETHWEQLYLPLDHPIPAAKGQSVLLSLRSTSSDKAGTHIAWTAVQRGADGSTVSRQAMDLDKGWIG